jgi:hypothetical protein
VLATLSNTLLMESSLLPEGWQERLVDGCYLLPEEPGLASWRLALAKDPGEHTMAPNTLLLPRAPRAARRMAEAAKALLVSLDAEQRALASFPFDGDVRYQWSYTPGPRAGLPLKAMTAAQRSAALQLFDAGLSVRGAATARQIIAHEAILRETERIEQMLSGEDRDPELYYFTVFGTPGSSSPWSWRANGHHLALHFTVVGERARLRHTALLRRKSRHSSSRAGTGTADPSFRGEVGACAAGQPGGGAEARGNRQPGRAC